MTPNSRPNPRIVITGGPGAGKSTLIQALAARGLLTEPEAGRAIIRDRMQQDGVPPWADPVAFARAMADHDRQTHARHEATREPVFFDRGLPDVLGYLRLCGLPAPADLVQDVQRLRYRDPAFIAPFWPDIYVQDAERLQTPDEARLTFEIMADVYLDLGYDLIPLPLAPIEERLAFILSSLD